MAWAPLLPSRTLNWYTNQDGTLHHMLTDHIYETFNVVESQFTIVTIKGVHVCQVISLKIE
jgi:hypothetical protein